MFHCPFCGKSNQAAASFCIHCGEPLDEESLAELATSGSQSADKVGRDQETGLGALFQSRRLEFVLGIALVVAVVGFALLTYVNQTVVAEHYRAGQEAFARADYARAVSEFTQAGDYLSSRAQADEANLRLRRINLLYDAVQQAASEGRWWQVARDIASSDDLQRSRDDIPALLAKARSFNGKIVYRLDDLDSPGETTHGLYVADADGGNRQYISGTNFLSNMLAISPDNKWVVYENLGEAGTLFYRPTAQRVYLYNLESGRSQPLNLSDPPTVDTWARFGVSGQFFVVGNDLHVSTFDVPIAPGGGILAPASSEMVEQYERHQFKALLLSQNAQGETVLAIGDYDGANAHTLAVEDGKVDGALFSRDGSYVMYRVCADGNVQGMFICTLKLAEVKSPQEGTQTLATMSLTSTDDNQNYLTGEFTLDGNYALILQRQARVDQARLYALKSRQWIFLPDAIVNSGRGGEMIGPLLPDYSPGLGFWQGPNTLAHTDRTREITTGLAGTSKYALLYETESHSLIVSPNGKYAVYFTPHRADVDFSWYEVHVGQLATEDGKNRTVQPATIVDSIPTQDISGRLVDSVRFLPDGYTLLISNVYYGFGFHSGITACQLDTGDSVDGFSGLTNARARLLTDNRPLVP
jgi:hypothetical protein